MVLLKSICGSETSSRRSSPPPSSLDENNSRDEAIKSNPEDPEDKHGKNEAAQLSEMARQKRMEAARLEAEAEEAERQSETIAGGGVRPRTRTKEPDRPLTEREICGEERAMLYLQHLQQIQTHEV